MIDVGSQLDKAIMKLAKLEADEDDIIRAIGQTERDILVLNYQLAMAQSPFKPGDKVKSETRTGWVVLVKPGIFNRPDLKNNWVAYVMFLEGIPTGMQLFPSMVYDWAVVGTWPGHFTDLVRSAQQGDTCIHDRVMSLSKEGFKVTSAGVMVADTVEVS